MGPNRPRLLIVDDDQDLSLMLSILMKKEGIAGMVAPDGETALEMVSAEMPDMLLVDVKMPGMDGMEVLKQVKENDPDLPVVLITAYAEIRDSVAAMRAGAFESAETFRPPKCASTRTACPCAGGRRRSSRNWRRRAAGTISSCGA